LALAMSIDSAASMEDLLSERSNRAMLPALQAPGVPKEP